MEKRETQHKDRCCDYHLKTSIKELLEPLIKYWPTTSNREKILWRNWKRWKHHYIIHSTLFERFNFACGVFYGSAATINIRWKIVYVCTYMYIYIYINERQHQRKWFLKNYWIKKEMKIEIENETCNGTVRKKKLYLWWLHLIFWPQDFFSQTRLDQKLTVCSKLCFAIGGAPNQVAGSATAFFLQIYLLDIAQVRSLGILISYEATL